MLHNTDAGVRIGQDIYNCFAYADDVTLFSATIPGLQQLINVCSSYASKWRFVFGIEKTRILCLGNDSWCKKPTWYLGNQSNEINNVSELNLLGLTYTTSGSYDTHIQNRISATRRSLYKYNDKGWCFPGLSCDSKVYLWKSTGVKALTFGLDCVKLSKANMRHLESAQGTLIKQVLGLSKRSHHSKLLKALNIQPISQVVGRDTLSLASRICSVQSPAKNLYIHDLSLFILSGARIPGTLVDRLLSYGFSPMAILLYGHGGETVGGSTYKAAVRAEAGRPGPVAADGGVDSLAALLSSPNYNRPGSIEHSLVQLLTRF